MDIFDENRAATLRAAVDRIIPPDDLSPGGVAAGAYDFLLRHLTPGGYFPHLLPEYEAGLDSLDRMAQQLFSTPFAELEAGAQDTTLIRFESEAKTFFPMLVEQCQEGFFTSPAAFAMIGWQVTG